MKEKIKNMLKAIICFLLGAGFGVNLLIFSSSIFELLAANSIITLHRSVPIPEISIANLISSITYFISIFLLIKYYDKK